MIIWLNDAFVIIKYALVNYTIKCALIEQCVITFRQFFDNIALARMTNAIVCVNVFNKKQYKLKRKKRHSVYLLSNNSENGCSFHSWRGGGRQRSCFLASAQFRQFTSFSRPIKGMHTHTLWNREKERRRKRDKAERFLFRNPFKITFAMQ